MVIIFVSASLILYGICVILCLTSFCLTGNFHFGFCFCLFPKIIYADENSCQNNYYDQHSQIYFSLMCSVSS